MFASFKYVFYKVSARLWGREEREEVLGRSRVPWEDLVASEEGVARLLTSIVRCSTSNSDLGSVG